MKKWLFRHSLSTNYASFVESKLKNLHTHFLSQPLLHALRVIYEWRQGFFFSIFLTLLLQPCQAVSDPSFPLKITPGLGQPPSLPSYYSRFYRSFNKKKKKLVLHADFGMMLGSVCTLPPLSGTNEVLFDPISPRTMTSFMDSPLE